MKSNPKKPSPNSFSSKRAERHRKRQQTQGIKVMAGVGTLAALILLILFTSGNQPGGVGAIEGVQTFPNVERGHTAEPVTYDQTPPVGGRHNPVWQNCGVYTEPLVNENAVHSLEHGAVWITYQPDLPADELQKLQDFTRRSGYRLLSPYPGLPSPIALSSWGYKLELDQADDQRLNDFIQKYEQNPQGPEPGAPCTGGQGQPG